MRTSSLHPFAYRVTLPDGQVVETKRSTRHYTWASIAQVGRLPGNYNADTHPPEGAWIVLGQHSRRDLALGNCRKWTDWVDPTGTPREFAPDGMSHRQIHRTYTEVRVVPMDNVRPTCGRCGGLIYPVGSGYQHEERGPDGAGSHYDHAAELFVPQPDPPATAPAPDPEVEASSSGWPVPDEAEMARRRGLVAEAARSTRARMEADQGPVSDEPDLYHQRITQLEAELADRDRRLDDLGRRLVSREAELSIARDALSRERAEGATQASAYEETATERRERLEEVEAELDEARTGWAQTGNALAKAEGRIADLEAHVAEGETLETQAAELLTQVAAERDRLAQAASRWQEQARSHHRRAERLDAEVRRYLDRFELVTLERDQLREATAEQAQTFEHLIALSAADRQVALDEAGRMLDRLEAIEAASPPRPVRAEVADFADERDRMIAANADDPREEWQASQWHPVLSGRIPIGRGMPEVRVYDPEDPVARAFFLDDPTGQAAHDREVAVHAESEVAERSWHDEMADPPEVDDGG